MKKRLVVGLVLIGVCFFSGMQFAYSASISELIPRIRTEFNIPVENVPDALLIRFLENKDNKDFIEYIIKQINFGNSVQSGVYFEKYVTDFLKSVRTKVFYNTVSYLLYNSPILKSIWAIWLVFKTLDTGRDVYYDLAKALSASDMMSLAILYKDIRYSSGQDTAEAADAAWADLVKDVWPVVDKVLQMRKCTELELHNYFEMYYQSWSLANDKKNQKAGIREYIYNYLSIMIPKVTVDPIYGIPGTTFHFVWTDFKPKSFFVAYLIELFGDTIFEKTLRADDQGQATYDFDSTTYPTGTYHTWAVERKSGLRTDTKSFEIRENRVPSIPQKPAGPDQGYTGNLYTFSTSSADPDGHPFQIQYDWGDGNISDWGEASQSHAWNMAGVYDIRARAKDAYDALSEWSASSQISVFLLGNSHVLIISSGSGGNTNPAPGQYIYTASTSVQINAVPASGYVFNRWVGDLPIELAHTNPLSLIMDQDRTIQAEFSATSQATAWPMNLHDARNSGQSECSGPQTNNLSWTYTLSSGTSGGYVGTPVVAADGTIYVGSGTMYEGYLNAINKDGNLKWKSINLGACPNAPAIGEDGTIYVALYDFGGYFYALNPQDGSIKWNYFVGDRTSDPIIGQDGTIYFTSESRYLYALTPDGNLKWQYNTGQFVGPPIISNSGYIFIFSWMYGGLSMTKLGLDGTFISGRALYMGMYSSGVSVSADGKLFVSSATSVLAISSETGDFLWSFDAGTGYDTNYSTPVQISNEKVVAASKGKVCFIDASTGVQLSTYVDADSTNLAPIQCVVDKDGVAYTGFRDNSSVSGPSKLVAVNPDGALKWSYTLHWFDTRPVISDGVLYVAGIDADYSFKLYAFRL